MKIDIEQRAKEVAQYIISTNCNVREAAKRFGVSKSTVSKDVSERLQYINPELYKEVRKIIEHHLEIRHINGGEATRKKYKGAN